MKIKKYILGFLVSIFAFFTIGFVEFSYADNNPSYAEDFSGLSTNDNDIELNMPFKKGEDTIVLGDKPNSFKIISDYVGMVYKWWAVVTGLLAVLMVVVGGVQYIISGADPGQKDDAKDRIQQALVALTLLLLSALILRTINPNFFT